MRDFALENAEAGDVGRFFAAFEEDLVAETNAEVGLAGENPFAERLDEIALRELLHTIAEGADAGEEDVGGVGEASGIGHELERELEVIESIGDAAQISCAVVDEGNFHNKGKRFVLGLIAEGGGCVEPKWRREAGRGREKRASGRLARWEIFSRFS